PEQADFLAQANNQGGGEHEKTNRPRDAQAGVVAQAESGVAPRPMRAQSPAPRPPPEARVVSRRSAEQPMPTPDARLQAAESRPDVGQEKIDQDRAMARLAAEIHLRSERYSKRPKRKFVSASTTEWAWAGYLRAWVDRVERV